MHLKLLQTRKGQSVLHARPDRPGSDGSSSKERARLNLKEQTLLVRPAKYWPRLPGCCGASTTTGLQEEYRSTTARNDVNTVASFEADGQTRYLQHTNTTQNHHTLDSPPCLLSIPSLLLLTPRTSTNRYHIQESPDSQRNTANLEKFNLLQPPGSQGKQDTKLWIALNVLMLARYFFK